MLYSHHMFPSERKEKTGDLVRFSPEQCKALEERGRTIYVELHGETLSMLEAQTGTKSCLHGEKAEEAKTVPAMQGVEVAINLDNTMSQETLEKPFTRQLAILSETNEPIQGVKFIHPQTPADAVAMALNVCKQTGNNILWRHSTRVGKDGYLLVGRLRPGDYVDVDEDLHPDVSRDTVWLLSIAVPTSEDGR